MAVLILSMVIKVIFVDLRIFVPASFSNTYFSHLMFLRFLLRSPLKPVQLQSGMLLHWSSIIVGQKLANIAFISNNSAPAPTKNIIWEALKSFLRLFSIFNGNNIENNHCCWPAYFDLYLPCDGEGIAHEFVRAGQKFYFHVHWGREICQFWIKTFRQI